MGPEAVLTLPQPTGAIMCVKAAADWTERYLRVVQAYGCMEFRRGNMDKARELFQHGVWADPSSRGVTAVWQVSLASHRAVTPGPHIFTSDAAHNTAASCTCKSC